MEFQIWQLNKSGRSLCRTRAASCVCQGWAVHMRGATAVVEGLGTLLPGVLTLLIYRPRFVRLARNSNSRGFARQTVIIRCGQMSADTKVSTQTGFSAYSEVSIALIIFMHDYSERRGQLRWRASDVARCARQQKENG